ncbi:MAG: ATP-binding protein [Holosporales bacterium]
MMFLPAVTSLHKMRFRAAAQLRRWKRQPPWFGLAIALAVLSVGATIVYLIGLGTRTASSEILLLLVALDALALLLLAVPVSRRIGKLWLMRKQGITGSRLHSRLVLLFTSLAVTPALIVILFSAVMFNAGLEHWFSQKVKVALRESVNVAEAYLAEHQQTVRADAVAMANDLNTSAAFLLNSPQRLANALYAQAALRDLTEVIVFDSKLNILGRAGFSLSLEFSPLSESAISRASRGDVIVLTSEQGDKVRALLRLSQFVDAYLYVGRSVDPQVIAHTEATRNAVDSYFNTERQRVRLQILVTVLMALVGIVLALLAVWAGLNLANRLIQPIARLAAAAEQLRQGSYTEVPLPSERDEIRSLTKAFNRMGSDLNEQRLQLVEKNEQLDLRRRFTEAVLEGVTTGVMGVDEHFSLHVFNRHAVQVLGLPLAEKIGAAVPDFFPEIAPLLERAAKGGSENFVESQLQLSRDSGVSTLLTRIAPEIRDGVVIGYILTFDDISALLHAQKVAAWADVAKRLAHEIKNPLTPIQLSAERLQRKYAKQISEGGETFTELTDTIMRQVDDIGRLVDEFSSFARMPQPLKKKENLVRLVTESVSLFRETTWYIHFEVQAQERTVLLAADAALLRQALTNLIKNAVEAVEEKYPDKQPGGAVTVTVSGAAISIRDNGNGFISDSAAKAGQPYYTTKRNGTGLGLAIVRKIVEEHGGTLVLRNHENGGAEVRLNFAARG